MSLLIVFVRGVTELIEVLAEVTLNELAVTFLAGEGVFFNNNHSTRQHGVYLAVHFETFPRRVVHVHVVLVVNTNLGFSVWIPHQNVGV
jgi:hypothetical protein